MTLVFLRLNKMSESNYPREVLEAIEHECDVVDEFEESCTLSQGWQLIMPKNKREANNEDA